MSELLQTLRALIRDELRCLRLGDLAVVTSAFPHAEGDEHNFEVSVKLRESELELRKVPMCTPHIGMASPPAVGELVLVTYVGGDANRPLILGRLYSDEHNPPEHAEAEWTVHSTLEGKTSLTLNKDGDVVAAAGETTLTLKKDGDILAVAGKTTLTLKKDGDIEIVSGADLKIGTEGALKIDAKGDVALSAGGDVKIKASGKAAIKGSAVELG